MGKLNFTTQQMAALLAKMDAMPSAMEILTPESLIPYATVAALNTLMETVTALQTRLNTLENRFNTLLGEGDVSAVIDSFSEMEDFLSGVTNSQTLTGMLVDMRTEIVGMIPTGTAQQSSLDALAARVTAVETSSAAHDSGIAAIQTAVSKRPALPDDTETGAVYAVKNGSYVCLIDSDEVLLSTNRN